jgi:hypothetical protein
MTRWSWRAPGPAAHCSARARKVAAGAFVAILLFPPALASGLDVKLWPLIDYHSDAEGHRTLQLLGPLFTYEGSPESEQITLRPLFSFTRGPRASRNQLSILYPLFVSHWEPTLTDYRLFGLITYTIDTEPHPDGWDRRFTIFPFVFYRYSHLRGARLSVLPFYADVDDFLGYQRIRMFLFPLYLRLEEALTTRTWLPFPFVSWSGGTLGSGYRIWPLYGWDQDGETDRYMYVLWPFYISREKHFTRPECEQQLIMFPFYSSIDSPTTYSRAYGLFTHSIDRKAGTETWGFPWPLWLTQYELNSGKRTALRLAPFYGDSHFGDLHSHFVMWPVYRWRSQDLEDYSYSRSDVFWLLYRNIDEAQPQTRHRRHVRTLFPLYRAVADDDHEEMGTLALLDALFPRNANIQQLYAPLWQLYTRERDADLPPRWSMLWDLISSDGKRVRYPVYLDLSH